MKIDYEMCCHGLKRTCLLDKETETKIVTVSLKKIYQIKISLLLSETK